jgi:hypothetical protein
MARWARARCFEFTLCSTLHTDESAFKGVIREYRFASSFRSEADPANGKQNNQAAEVDP